MKSHPSRPVTVLVVGDTMKSRVGSPGPCYTPSHVSEVCTVTVLMVDDTTTSQLYVQHNDSSSTSST